jgi:hypothetical protein
METPDKSDQPNRAITISEFSIGIVIRDESFDVIIGAINELMQSNLSPSPVAKPMYYTLWRHTLNSYFQEDVL